MMRGSPAIEVMVPTLLEVSDALGCANRVEFVRLKTSQRNCSFVRSVMPKSRVSPKSKTLVCGPRSVLRPLLPEATPVGGRA